MKLFTNKPFAFLAALFLFTLGAHALVIVNPGFFNHDEWQRYDHIYSHGFEYYVQKVGVLKAGREFGAPVRPFGFIQEGFSALFMMTHPWVSHLMDVGIHFLDAMAFYLLLGRFQVPNKIKNIAVLLFIVSPLGVFSTAWVGASFDRLYVLFSMTAGFCAAGLYQHKNIYANSIGLFLSACFAMASKETALMLPAFIFLSYVGIKINSSSVAVLIKDKHFYLVSILVGVPILVFLIIRAPAIYNTLFVYASPEYSPKLSFFLRNITYYLAYPFYWGSADMYTMMFENKVAIYVALAMHLSMMIAIAVKFGARALLIYLALYFIFLLPVIFVSSIAAHYLYSTTPVMSLALAYLLTANNRWILFFCICLLVLSFFRFFQIQTIFYEDGVCQAKSIATLDAALLNARAKKAITTINIWGEPGIKTYIVNRTVFGRTKNGPYKGLVFSSVPENTTVYDLNLHMHSNCELIAE